MVSVILMRKPPVLNPNFINALKRPSVFLVLMGCLLCCLPVWAAVDVPPDPPLNDQMQHRITRFMAGVEQEHPAWLQYPELMALQWVGLPMPAQRMLKTLCSPVENPQVCQVVVKQGQLLDDAVLGSKTTLKFHRKGQGWVLDHVVERWRCRRLDLPASDEAERPEVYQLKPCP